MPRGRQKGASWTNDVIYSPPEIFEAINVEFDLDVCAPIEGVAWIPAKKWISEAENGLASEWRGKVWMNPPYSYPAPWVDKWLDHKNGFALLPISTGKWFYKLWDSEAQMAIMDNHFCFILPNGERKGIFAAITLWAIGETNITALEMSDLGRVR